MSMRRTGWRTSLYLALGFWTLQGCSSEPVPTDTPTLSPAPGESPTPEQPTPTLTPVPSDKDQDGFSVGDGDCDDDDDTVNPGAAEIPYDGLDQDCDGSDLNDLDQDGFVGTEAGGKDCDDEDNSVYPKAEEVPYDGVDQDCDGADLVDVDGDGDPSTLSGGTDCDDTDPGRAGTLSEIAYDGVDQDCDGQDLVDVDGDGQTALEAKGDDCDDEDNTIFTGAPEVPYDDIDQDCNGVDLIDVDGDSYAGIDGGGDDCDDQDVNTYPGAPEFKDGKDNDCDGKADNNLDSSDDDGDGQSELDGDCNDKNNQVYPGATEVPYDGIDQDCSGTDLVDVDQDGQAATQAGGQDCNDQEQTIYAGAEELPYDGIDQDCSGKDLTDVDGDGFDASTVSGSDCDDDNIAVNPSATEVCNGIDDDCKNGTDADAVDRNTYYLDTDGDSYGDPAATVQLCQLGEGMVSNAGDCDDKSAAVNPQAQEVCNSIDDDCDKATDDDDASVQGQNTWYVDVDLDGYGSVQTYLTCASVPTSGYSLTSNDCNDAAEAVNPGESETCNSIDDNCSGEADEGVKLTFYQDSDDDGYGNANATSLACTAPEGYITDSSDCNDTDAAVNPGAIEVCNSKDDDCDKAIDDADSSITGQTTFYADADNDGYGNANSTKKACTKPTGYVTSSTDCNDTDAAVNPGATEVCNSKDDDCDNTIDDADSSITGQTTFYADADNDGYGNANSPKKSCSKPTGYVTSSTDCNDADAAVNPGATEVCNSKDDDCDNAIDDADSSITGQNTFYADADNDGYGSATSPKKACSKPTGYVTSSTDCNDADAAVNPGATEICNSKDDDCDNATDDADSSITGQATFYADADNDGYGNASSPKKSCSKPTGYVTSSTDCNDSDATINPAATEVCNSKDDDCDNATDDADSSVTGQSTFYADADNDGYGNANSTKKACTKPSGYVTSSTDCNDSNANVNPGKTETCNSVDDNCNGSTDEGVTSTFYRDADGDGYGNKNSTIQACTPPSGYVTNSTDCNDSNANVNPGKAEVPGNAIDDNCNGQTDEVAACSSYTDKKAAALAACKAKFATCVDTGSVSYIGYASNSCQGCNCDPQDRWQQFCYAVGYDSYNCNQCRYVGEIQAAHSPCNCNEDNTATIGSWCTGGAAPDLELPESLKPRQPAQFQPVPMCSKEDEEADIFDIPSAYLGCNPSGRGQAVESVDGQEELDR